MGREVVYKPATIEANDAALTAVESLFRSNGEVKTEYLASKIICGPALWQMIKLAPNIAVLDLTPATAVVPLDNGQFQEFNGALFQSNEEKLELIETIRSILSKAQFEVRYLNEREKQIYWGLIPYDIEEPIFILDNGERNILVDFIWSDGVAKLFWIGDMSQFSFSSDND